MTEYSVKAIKDWLHRTIGANKFPTKYEVQADCPYCGKSQFYFNVQKEVGCCHHAGCGETPTLENLIELVGFSPDERGEWEREEIKEEEPEYELPGTPILKMENGVLLASDEEALTYLRGRGLTDQVILNWGLTSDGQRIYVPIYDGGVLKNYNSRLMRSSFYRGDSGGLCEDMGGVKKYLYAPGSKTSRYILGWSESKLWSSLVLVENTFVSLSYRSDMHCSTTFGSFISDVQADLIAESNVRRVALLWDENAERNAGRCVKKLHDRGVPAAYWIIKGQPDDYPQEWVAEKAKLVLEAASDGVPYIDFREECDDR